jgi:predicted metalloprotease with PDZ domain
MEPKSIVRAAGCWLGAIALLGLVSLAVVQQQTVVRLRQENEILRADTNELGRLRAAPKETPPGRNEEAEIQQLREENRDLLRLRNEVHQLRELQQQAEALRTANAGLLQAMQSTSLSSNQQTLVVAARKEGAILGINIRSAGDPQNGVPTHDAYNGAVVMWVDPNSPVAGSGLKVADIIVRVDGRTIDSAGQLQAEMLTRQPGDMVTLDVMRNDAVVRIPVKSRAWPK